MWGLSCALSREVVVSLGTWNYAINKPQVIVGVYISRTVNGIYSVNLLKEGVLEIYLIHASANRT